MRDKRVIGYFAAGFLIAAAIGGGIYVRFHQKTGGVDDPIVVAGGSLEIGSRYGFEKDPGGDLKKAIHSDPTRYLNRVEVLYNKPASAGDEGGPAYAQIVPNGGQPVTIDIAYCLAKCSNPSTSDKITFNADLDHKNLYVSNHDQANPIGNIPAGSIRKRLSHGEPAWQVNLITVDGQDYLCDKGKCQVVLHYCSTNGPTDCQ